MEEDDFADLEAVAAPAPQHIYTLRPGYSEPSAQAKREFARALEDGLGLQVHQVQAILGKPIPDYLKAKNIPLDLLFLWFQEAKATGEPLPDTARESYPWGYGPV
jgi:hypothetical protein